MFAPLVRARVFKTEEQLLARPVPDAVCGPSESPACRLLVLRPSRRPRRGGRLAFRAHPSRRAGPACCPAVVPLLSHAAGCPSPGRLAVCGGCPAVPVFWACPLRQAPAGRFVLRPWPDCARRKERTPGHAIPWPTGRTSREGINSNGRRQGAAARPSRLPPGPERGGRRGVHIFHHLETLSPSRQEGVIKEVVFIITSLIMSAAFEALHKANQTLKEKARQRQRHQAHRSQPKLHSAIRGRGTSRWRSSTTMKTKPVPWPP